MMFSHKHAHEAIAVQHKSPGAFQPVVTFILWRCKCGDVTTQQIPGQWTLAQVRGERDLTATEQVEVSLLVDEAREAKAS
jgi:hypothetical protein